MELNARGGGWGVGEVWVWGAHSSRGIGVHKGREGMTKRKHSGQEQEAG